VINPNEVVLRPDSYYAGLEITNDIMFATTMGQNPEFITELLREMLPNEEIGSVLPSGIDTTNIQQAFFPAVYAHGNRYDVFHTDGRRLFDVEMHNSNKKSLDPSDVMRLTKRTRYAHSVMDITSLRQGEDYTNLKKHYVIYICTFDLIGKGGYVYEPIIPWFVGFENDLFDEGRRTIFFNTKGCIGVLTAHMKEILKYMDNPKAYPVARTDVALIKRIDEAVKFNQQNPIWRRNYEMLAMREHDIAIEAVMREKYDTARNMFRLNISVEIIMQVTGLSLDEVLSIKNERVK
jgi:predicted transposase/invertase (TIGR01784 family)